MDKEFLIQCLEKGMTQHQIAEIVGEGKSTVGYWISKYKLNQLSEHKKPEYKDEKMFNKIDTKEKAYIIGYSLADAYISEDGIEFGCALADKELLDFIGDCTGAKVRIDNTYNPAARRFPRARISINNKNLITDFLKHGSKKEDKHIPIIKKELNRYLIQGFFDGDGCLTWGIRKDRNRIWQKISFTASYKLLLGIQAILLKDCNIATSIHPKGKENVYVLEFAGKENVLKFLDYIYPDDTFIVLKRKYEKAKALRLELGEFGEGPRTPSEA